MRHLAACLALLAALPAAAQDRAATFAAHLDAVPATALALFDGVPDVAFGDLDAAARAIATPPAGAAAYYAAAEGPAVRAAIPALADRITLASNWPATVGFGLQDLHSWTGIDLPPQRLLILGLDPAVHPAVTDTLLATGYALADRAAPAWFRNTDDFAIDMAARDPANPFGGQLGMASRVTFVGPLLLQSPGWPLIDAALAGGDSLADRPDIAALLASLDALPGDAGLVTAYLALDSRRYLTLGPPYPRDAAMPVWSAALFADLSDGQTETAVIALAYATRDEAKAAARALSDRWQFDDVPGTDRTLADLTGAALTVAVTGTGPFVTVADATALTAVDGGRIVNPVFDLIQRVLAMGALVLIQP